LAYEIHLNLAATNELIGTFRLFGSYPIYTKKIDTVTSTPLLSKASGSAFVKSFYFPGGPKSDLPEVDR